MKRLYLIAIAIAACVCSFAQSTSKSDKHSMLFWIDGGTSMTFDQLDWTTMKLGGGGMIGVGYQWKKQLFVLNTGAEVGFFHRALGIADTELSQDMLDTENMPFTYHGLLKDRTDMTNSLDINLPLLVGIEGERGYLLAGIKIGINGYTWFKQRGYYSTEGLYDRFYDPLVNMPNHGFHDFEETTSKNKLWMGVELLGSIDMGFIIRTENDKIQMRLGIYGDYSIYQYNNRLNNNAGHLLISDWNQYLQLTMNHAYLSNEGVKSALNNLTAGIKLTIQWQYKNQYQCVICNWANKNYF